MPVTHPCVGSVARRSAAGVAVISLYLVLTPAAAGQKASTEGGAPGALGRRTFAVAPFVNLSGQASDEWIGAGIAATLTADLQRQEGISVLTGAAFVDAEGPVGRELPDANADPDKPERAPPRGQRGATWLVTGSYQRVGDLLRITARIIDLATGEVSARATVNGRGVDLFTLQDQILPALAVGISMSDAPGDRGDGDAGNRPVPER